MRMQAFSGTNYAPGERLIACSAMTKIFLPQGVTITH